MKRACLTALLFALLGAGAALGYTRPRFDIGTGIVQPRWASGTIPIVVNTNGPNIVPGSQPFEAVRNAFHMRSAYSTLRFDVQPGAPEIEFQLDGINLVTFVDTQNNRDIVGNFGAVTYFWFDIIEGQPVIFESDVVFNPQYSKSTVGGANTIDIEALCNHELTHTMAMDHGGVLAATAYPDLVVDFTKDTLTLDDVAGTEFLYPFADTPATTGALSGNVLAEGSNNGLFGANVVAVRQSDGMVVTDISTFNGEWRIDALPPGDYAVYAEPYDGPYLPFMICCGVYKSMAFQLLDLRFAGGNAAPTIFGLAAGQEISGIVINPPQQSPTLVPNFLGKSPNAFTAVLDEHAVEAYQGTNMFLTVGGVGIDGVPDDGLSVTGPGVHVSPNNVVRGTAGGYPVMIVKVTIDADAPAVARSILADDGTSLGALTGGFEVLPWPPPPGLLRNDELQQLAAPPASLFPLDPVGPDAFAGTGEGALLTSWGSDDDDDLYVPEIRSGFVEPDEALADDALRPLVFYQLTDPSLTLRLTLTPSRRVQVLYE